MSYTHIPVLDRLAIAWQVRFGKPDDRVGVYLDRIVGGSGSQYGSALYGMHFGRTTKCEEVTRTGWAAGHIEPASAYCRGRWCVVIPDVCGNISWATRDLSAPPVNHVPTPATFGLVLTALAALSLSQRQT